MSTLELLQLQNEHKGGFFEKGEDETQEQEGEASYEQIIRFRE